MQSWKSVSEQRAVLVRSLFCGVLVLGAVRPIGASAADPWLWQPWVSVSGGNESDLILDPELTRTVVPGGAFTEIAPGFRLSRRLSRTTSFRLLNRTSWERFYNDAGRTLFGSLLFGEFQFAGDSMLRGRVALSGDYFNDSGAATFRRYSGGGEAGVGIETSHWKLEISGFIQGRAYPNVGFTNLAGTVQDYSESHQGVSGSATWRPTRSLFLRGQLTGRNTDSVDPAFESTSLTATGSAELRLSRRAWCSGSFTTQARDFSQRLPGTDSDSYYQYGLGVGYNVSRQVSLVGRYAYAEYTYPLGQNEDTQRVSLAATWQFGKRAPMISRTRPRLTGDGRGFVLRQSPVLLRVQAPEARQVYVAGTFNQWNPKVSQLAMTADGWWELRLDLTPGVYKYVYVIDGQTVTPSDADRVVDDGFGGENGVLEVVGGNR